MRAAWVEVCRFKAIDGSSARDARDWFALEKLNTPKPAVWMEEGLGTFTVLGRTFRIWIGGLHSDFWVVEELKAKGSRNA